MVPFFDALRHFLYFQPSFVRKGRWKSDIQESKEPSQTTGLKGRFGDMKPRYLQVL